MGFLFRKKKTGLKAKGSKVIYGKLLKFVILIVIYIYVYGYISAAWEESPSLTIPVMPEIVDRGEYLSITGTATAVEYVDIIFIPPRGNEGIGVNGEKGISHFRVPVHNDRYSLQLRICEKADLGVWYVLVLSVGKDGQYGVLEGTDLITLLQKLRNKPYDSSQILDIIADNTWNKAGSDDLVACKAFKIIGSKNMHINPINTLEVGEELKVSGTISSPDAEVKIRITGPMEVPERSVQVRDGKFQAIFDTTDLVPGTYIVIAESENAYGTKSFEITIPATPIPSPTPTTVQTPRATPTQTPKAITIYTPVPASVVSPTPTKNQAHVQYVPQQVVSPTPTPQASSALSNYLYLIPIALLLILSLLILYIKREEKLREQKRKEEIERKSGGDVEMSKAKAYSCLGAILGVGAAFGIVILADLSQNEAYLSYLLFFSYLFKFIWTIIWSFLLGYIITEKIKKRVWEFLFAFVYLFFGLFFEGGGVAMGVVPVIFVIPIITTGALYGYEFGKSIDEKIKRELEEKKRRRKEFEQKMKDFERKLEEERRRKKEYEQKMKEFKLKLEQWKEEGYNVSELEEMLK